MDGLIKDGCSGRSGTAAASPLVSELSLGELLGSTTLLAVSLDRRGRVTFVNESVLTLLGAAEEQVIGREWFATFVPEAERSVAASVFGSTQP